jgi:hypothetical protein
VIPLLFFAAAAQFAGTWVLEVDGRVAAALTLDAKGGKLIRPAQFHIDGDGEISRIGGHLTEIPVKWNRKRREFRAEGDVYRLETVDSDHATLALAEMPWVWVSLRRVREGERVRVSADWPQPRYAPEIVALQKRIKAMVEEDQEARRAGNIAPAAIEEVDRGHRAEVEAIFAKYGWPKRSIVGGEAAHDYWLLVQHQPLDLQQRMLPAMEIAAGEREASRSDYAYLYDRVRIGEGKPQRWGTQARCVNGLPVLSPVEDPAGLEARRRELRMLPVAEYLKGMKEFCR